MRPIAALSLTLLIGIEAGWPVPGHIQSGQPAGFHQSSDAASTPQKVTLHAAGATFPYPIYSSWIDSYGKIHPKIQIDYQAVGSGAGIDQYRRGVVDFAGIDTPLSDKELASLTRPPLHIPTVANAIVPIYNVSGVGSGLRLSGGMLADIFLGKITKWNNDRIRRKNPTTRLPGQTITVVHPAFGSGTTYIFTDYLSTVSPEWKAKVGTGKFVKWPIGYGAPSGGPGESGLVKSQSGSIGYDELAYAVQNKLTVAFIKNRAGNYMLPSLPSGVVAADVAAGKLAKDIRASIVNGPGEATYPIVGFTYLLIPLHPKDAARGRALLDFLRWTMGPGQKSAPDLLYMRLPPSVIALNLRALKRLQTWLGRSPGE